MLDNYYIRPRSVDRIRALWLGPSIDRYVEWLNARQAAHATVMRSVQTLIQFNEFALSHGATTWEDLPRILDCFVDQRIKKHGSRCRTEQDRASVRSTTRVPVEQFLQLLLPDFVGTQHCVPLPFMSLAPDFFIYLREERGLRPASLLSYKYNLRAFENYIKQVSNGDLSVITPTLINTYIIESAKQLSANGLKGRSGTLRAFLGYLYRQELIATDLSRAVPRGHSYRQSPIPRSITWEDIQRVLNAVDRRDPLGKRDYAILLLLTSYGLRAREITALQLDDLDWQHDQLHIRSRKCGHSTNYPLSPIVGEAIIDYLQAGRPNVEQRNLFLITKSPFTPISHGAVSQRAGIYLQAAGVQVPRSGSHTFRHACVQHLVDADVSFKVIGDYVGHRNPESTQIYGKAALHKLRELVTGKAEEII